MLVSWRKISTPLILIAIMMTAIGFSGRVLCLSDTHVAFEYAPDEEEDCESNCGSCVDVPLIQLSVVSRNTVKVTPLHIEAKNVVGLVHDDARSLYRLFQGNFLFSHRVQPFVSIALLALRTIVLLN